MAIWKAAVSLAMVLCIGFCAVPVESYPGFWANIAKSNCTRLPATSRDLSSSPHSAPELNSKLRFELRTASTGQSVSSLCPGGSYKLKVVFPASNGHYMVVSTHGNFSDARLCGGLDGCPNRACNCNITRRNDDELLCPLSGKEAEHDLVMPANNSLIGTLNVFQAVFISNNIGGLGRLQMNSLSYNFTSCAPALVTSVNATRLTVDQSSTLRIRAVNMPPPSAPTNAATCTPTVTSTPAGIVVCTPANPKFASNAVATTTCKALKAGVARVVIAFAGLNTTRVLRVV